MTTDIRTLVLVGPTAVGKTSLSLEVAQVLANDFGTTCEIVNADSMQLYRGMDIGTAKIALHERQGITHHMIDVLDITESASVSDYQSRAREVITQIHERGHFAIVVGGSGLFVQALLDDMQFPGSDPQVRDSLMAQVEEFGVAQMYQRLANLASEAAANILPTNVRRIVRALEVIELTGKAPVTALPRLPPIVPSTRIGLRMDRHELDKRIEQRVNQMWHEGFVAEVALLESQGLRSGVTARKALGYQQVLAALQDEVTLDQAQQSTIFATRRFARRQESWFNRDAKITWMDTYGITPTKIAATALGR